MEALRAHMGAVSDMADRKVLPAPGQRAQYFIRLSSFQMLASSDGVGQAIRATMRSTSLGLRYTRSSFQTVTVSPSRN